MRHTVPNTDGATALPPKQKTAPKLSQRRQPDSKRQLVSDCMQRLVWAISPNIIPLVGVPTLVSCHFESHLDTSPPQTCHFPAGRISRHQPKNSDKNCTGEETDELIIPLRQTTDGGVIPEEKEGIIDTNNSRRLSRKLLVYHSQLCRFFIYP